MDWNIHGHDGAVNLLQTHAAGEKLRHAYLFIGPEGVGRRTLALRFAQALNCQGEHAPGGFCGKCRDCRQIAAMQYPDLSFLLPEEGHRDILIDQVRALQHTLSLSPYSAKYRIALLPNFQSATEQAQNALLKTLEEPSDNVVLLLTADALESLLPTVVSRCEVVRLRPASIESAEAYLQTVKGLTAEKAELMAHLCSGRIGAALHFIEEPELFAQRKESLEMLLELLPAKLYERFALAEKLSKPHDTFRERVSAILPYWVLFWRDVFICAAGADLPLANLDLDYPIHQVANGLSLKESRALLDMHDQALQHLDANVNVRLLLENLMLDWPHVSITGYKVLSGD